MKNLIPDLIGAAGYCLSIGGLYVLFGTGVALLVAGVGLMAGAFVLGRG
ncbi:hypothetical protein [Pseudomonas quasicaspiana]|nr:hypothetical protein [Pseudomonas quasicaspiana]MCD5980504.1 hypothetical protein [Pseudomonas quasicaspiana]